MIRLITFRDDIRDAINQILREGSAKDFNELLYKLEDAGYEIKRGKHMKKYIRVVVAVELVTVGAKIEPTS